MTGDAIDLNKAKLDPASVFHTPKDVLGGKSLQRLAAVPRPNSEVADPGNFGVMFLTLHPDSYDWHFESVDPDGFHSSGYRQAATAPHPGGRRR